MTINAAAQTRVTEKLTAEFPRGAYSIPTYSMLNLALALIEGELPPASKLALVKDHDGHVSALMHFSGDATRILTCSVHDGLVILSGVGIYLDHGHAAQHLVSGILSVLEKSRVS